MKTKLSVFFCRRKADDSQASARACFIERSRQIIPLEKESQLLEFGKRCPSACGSRLRVNLKMRTPHDRPARRLAIGTKGCQNCKATKHQRAIHVQTIAAFAILVGQALSPARGSQPRNFNHLSCPAQRSRLQLLEKSISLKRHNMRNRCGPQELYQGF